ncbi:MAG: hypothetical protein HKN36_03175 [Hellea sp.]|nr:hypothetical protein [Hellea sp.]
MTSWRKDLKWSWRGVVHKETGAQIDFTPGLFYDIYRWGVFSSAVIIRNFFRSKSATIVCYPKKVRSWYMIWSIFKRCGINMVGPERADKASLALHFFDNTQTRPPKPPNNAAKTVNFDCIDIRKSTVARTFKHVFGYDLSVEPSQHSGKMVVKSEDNGAHDGKIVQGPTKVEPDMVYQRVVNNETDDGHVRDYRCPMLFGKPLLIFIKERKTEDRFKNCNARVRLADPKDYFSADELTKVSQFCKMMKLDFGGIDILRDKESGQIYIVDVNKTDMGPPMSMSLKAKLKSVDIMAEAFSEELINTKQDTV